MNTFKKILRWWITVTSMIGFLVGWVFVANNSETEFANTANTGSTSTNTQVVDSLNLPAIPSVGSVNEVNNQPFTFSPSTTTSNQQFMPGLRTGGS